RNQEIDYSKESAELTTRGVIFTDIYTALKEHSELVKKYYMTQEVTVNEHKLTALHDALMNSGVYDYVTNNVEIEDEIQADYRQEENECALFNHVLIVAEESSTVTYVENYISNNKEEKSVSNIIAEVYAGDNARVSFGAVDHFAEGTTAYINRRGVAGANAQIDWALGQMNEGNTISENSTHLVGDGSVTNPRTVTVGKGRQIQNFTAQTVHHGLNT